MPAPFVVTPLGDDCYALNRGDRTVALISSQGYIDWILRRPDQRGARITSIRKETHLGHVLGLKLLLTTPTPATELRQFTWRIGADGETAALHGIGETADGRFRSETEAIIGLNEDTGEYEWRFHTTITCVAPTAQTLAWIEYNNILPSLCGWCFLYAPQKRYHSTLMAAADGTVWQFPHQHLLHYGGKIRQLDFAVGTWAGFFGEQDGSPVVTVRESSLPPDWGICDMYYDLHCGARPTGPLAPNQGVSFDYVCRYLTPAESSPLEARAQAVPILPADFTVHDYPRLELGRNHFDEPVHIERFDDASGFRQAPPQKVWDRTVGHRRRGSLRLTQDHPGELVWSAEPPSCIPASTHLDITALVKTQGCTGQGIFLRVRYHTFVWRPQPHVEWTQTLTSTPVTGTSKGWVQVRVPRLEVPEEQFDFLIWFDVILDGPGTAWVTDVDVDLVRVRTAVPTV